jgi:tetrahydromethanopterin S-methyltransferase subunit B
MRKGAAGAAAARKEMDSVAADLPTIRESLAESCTMVDKLREALGVALKYQDKLEPLLKDAPAHAARLAEDLPKVGSSLSQILRDTRRLKEVATALRQAQKGIDRVVTRWPEVRATLAKTATFLKLTRDQLDRAVQHRREYESAMQETVQVADTFTAMLPLITDQLEGRLYEEERTLQDLGQSLDEVSTALPAYAHTTSRLLEAGRLLAWLVAVIVGLHGSYLMLSVKIGRRYSL